LFAAALGHKVIADELPPGLEQAIRNPAIPMILDATIVKFTKEGFAEIKVNTVYKAPRDNKGAKVVPPVRVRGYAAAGKVARVTPLRVITNRGQTRFLFFLDGDLLYSTYNNRFEIREGKDGSLEVGTGFNGGGAPWRPLKDMIKLIPQNNPPTP
tara:strand:- start:3384 stop:3848 length:465 start_codon:yes stop_codon:yes gene_type:complete